MPACMLIPFTDTEHAMARLPSNAHIPQIEEFLSHCQLRKYPARSAIVQAGESSQSLYFIISGSVSVVIQDDQGRDMVVAYLNAGDFFGEMGLFEAAPVRSAWIRARSVCEIAEISYARYKELARQNAGMIFAVAAQMAGRLRATTRKVGDLAFLDVTGRVARTLLDLCRQPDAMTHPDGMQIRITRQEIGRIVGCSREMVGRVLKSLEEQGLLNVKGKTMVVFGTR